MYRIAPGRGFTDAAAVLGEGFAGVLERDGWTPYRKFLHATHQTCLAHLLRCVADLLGDAKRGQAKTPQRGPPDPPSGLGGPRRLRCRRAGPGRGRRGGLAVGRGGRPAAGRTDLLCANRRLLAQLGRERDALFTFLVIPEVQATNWRAEHAIRSAVVSRKPWGGNATWKGATTWQVLASVLATAAQQQHDPVALLIGLLRKPRPVVAELAIPPRRGAREPGQAHRPATGALRVTVTELVDRQASVVMDAAGAGFHAAVGELADGRLRAEHGIGGEPPLLEHLAQLIARPTDRPHNQTANAIRCYLVDGLLR